MHCYCSTGTSLVVKCLAVNFAWFTAKIFEGNVSWRFINSLLMLQWVTVSPLQILPVFFHVTFLSSLLENVCYLSVERVSCSFVSWCTAMLAHMLLMLSSCVRLLMHLSQSFHPTLCYNEICRNKGISLWNFARNSGLFSTESRSCCHQNSSQSSLLTTLMTVDVLAGRTYFAVHRT